MNNRKGIKSIEGGGGIRDIRSAGTVGNGKACIHAQTILNMKTVLLIAVLMLLFVNIPVWAGPEGSGINPGVRVGQWIQYNVAALFAPLIGLVALYYLLRRQFTKFLAFACFAVLVALFIFAGNDFKDAAVTLGRWIIGR